MKNYYMWSSFRRKKLDELQSKYKNIFKGIVLDIGGRDRGKFKKPKEKVDKWIFADIEEKHNPDIVLDVSNMNQVKDRSIDVISAMELFEHVEEIEKGLDECFRILKEEGRMVMSVPFMYSIHGDPYDFQRWTETKWRKELKKRGFKIEKFIITGRFFTVFGDMMRTIIKSMPKGIKHLFYLVFPLLDCFVFFDKFSFIADGNLGKFHGGYFIILRKS